MAQDLEASPVRKRFKSDDTLIDRNTKENDKRCILDLPTEIVHEIFDYVKLEDLLELASSSKELYSLFTSRPMRVLWEKMWSDRRLKECPDGWNVVTHTRYLLVDTCFGCKEKRGIRSSRRLQARFCAPCAKIFTGRGKEILIREFGDSVYKELKNDPNVYDLAPSLYGSFMNGTVCWSSDCDKPPLRTFVVEDFVDVVTKYLELDPTERPVFAETRKKLIKEVLGPDVSYFDLKCRQEKTRK